MIDHLCVIGVGLIGGSFARAIRQAGLVKRITGCGRNIDNLQTAMKLGIIDDFSVQIKEATKEADVIFIATPVRSTQAIFSQLREAVARGAIITDAGSTKLSVIHAAQAEFTKIPENFVPGHPIAGTENSGAAASFATLYQDHRVILTPRKETAAKALQQVTQLWQATGADVVLMDAEHHDMVLAATSHLPHLLAFSLVNTLTTLDEKQEIFENAAGGFKDFTRIASSDPSMWQDICLANKEALLTHLDHFSSDLQQLRVALEKGDSDYLYNVFSRAKQSRDDLVSEKSS